jgi:hypothetical protein
MHNPSRSGFGQSVEPESVVGTPTMWDAFVDLFITIGAGKINKVGGTILSSS